MLNSMWFGQASSIYIYIYIYLLLDRPLIDQLSQFNMQTFGASNVTNITSKVNETKVIKTYKTYKNTKHITNSAYHWKDTFKNLTSNCLFLDKNCLKLCKSVNEQSCGSEFHIGTVL